MNLGEAPASGHVLLPWDDLPGRAWRLGTPARTRSTSAAATTCATGCSSRSTRTAGTCSTCGLWEADRRAGPRHRGACPPGRGDRPGRGRSLQCQPLVRVGPVPERARMGNGPRGLLRGRRRLGLLPTRSRPLARVPLERGRHGRHLGHPARALPRARALERERRDPEGAHVRADRPAGEPRGGRQGVLVVPGGPAEPRAAQVALPLSAGRVPVRAARGPRPRAPGPRARAARHGRLRR